VTKRERLTRELQRAAIGHIAAAKKLGLDAAELLRMTTGQAPIPPDVMRKAKALPSGKPSSDPNVAAFNVMRDVAARTERKD
jgi:hypothetical protein